MTSKGSIQEYIHSLLNSKRMGHQVAFHKLLHGRAAVFKSPAGLVSESLSGMLASRGISSLFSHQWEAIRKIQSHRNVVVSTPTASGKTLIYNLPVMEAIERRNDARALYLFPLKALAQDQLRSFMEMAAAVNGCNATAGIYDGDTSAWFRKKMRELPPNVLLTNPEMLHLAVLAHHHKWEEFIRKLQFVVIDEIHTYRGVMGSHMAQVFRRFLRICRHYGSNPTFIFSSATIANPAQLARQLTGLEVDVITKSGAPAGRRHVVLLNPDTGPAQAAIMLLKAALHRGLRTIVYTQSRKMTELIAIWAGSRSGAFKDRISAYRAGFLPEERREIEAKLNSGELLAVISTSALELGIDIGDLDLCILVGYPGSVMATWQRGGRVGRGGQESALALIAGEDALDQYFIRNPAVFMEKQPEAAVINPGNLHVLKRHVLCAASELPLCKGEPYMEDVAVQQAVLKQEEKGALLRSAEGDRIFSSRKNPHRHVDLRGSGSRYTITCKRSGESKGEIDGFRAFKETHPGAIYLHLGETYRVESLDPETMTVAVLPAKVDYYTRVRGQKDTEILEVYQQKKLWGTEVYLGRLKVTDQVTGYEKWRIHAKKRLNIIPLDLPPLTFETEGFWFLLPPAVQKTVEKRYLHFMGGIHAMEHAIIGALPFFVMTDRNDLGGISIPMHPQTGSAAVFVYDGMPGGAGLSRIGYGVTRELFEHTRRLVAECPCETGCPACVHSPKCGSGNRPIDKAAAVALFDLLRNHSERSSRIPPCRFVAPTEREVTPSLSQTRTEGCYGVLDIETQRSAEEVGGWHRADRMGVSCAILYDSRTDSYLEFLEKDVPRLIRQMAELDLVVGFNIKRFDYQVLSAYSPFDRRQINTLDILEKVHDRLGYRLSLDHIAASTLGTQKTADGLKALEWWKQGEIQKIIDYCRKDVVITRDLFLYGRKNGYLLFTNKAGQKVRVPVKW